MNEPQNRLFECLEKVKDRETFIEFVRAQMEDRAAAAAIEKQAPERYRDSGSLDWQNTSIEAYFEGALSCVEDNGEKNPVLPKEPSWKSFADFLFCGKIYE